MDSVSINVSGPSSGGSGGHSGEKKRRKRKELDAMVAKMRGSSSSGRGSGPDDLEIHSESETTTSESGLRAKLIQQKGHSGVGGGGGGGGLLASTSTASALTPLSLCLQTCRGLWLVTAAAASFVVVLTVLAMNVQMKAQISQFSEQLDKGSSNGPML